MTPALDARIRPLTLRFEDPGLEARFRPRYRLSARRQVRVTLLVGAAQFLGFGLVDRWADPGLAPQMWPIRVAIAAALAGVAALSLTRAWDSIRGKALWAVALATAIGMFTLIAAGGAHDELRWVGLVLVVLASDTLLRLTFPALVGLAAAVTAAWLAAVGLAAGLNAEAATGGLVTLFSTNIIGLLAAYTIERYARREFLQERETERERERSERLLLDVLPAPIAARLKEEEGPIADHHAEVTVLFADIAGFTGLSTTLPPGELVSLLNAVFSGFDQLAAEHGVEKIKTIGDAYMAVAGLPEPAADHVERAADLALAMRDQVRERPTDPPIEMRIGIATGPVVAGVIGETRFLYDLWGDAVTTASRMESHGLAGAIQVTPAVRDRLAGRYALTERGLIDVKGKGPMTTWLLEGKIENGGKPPGSGRTFPG